MRRSRPAAPNAQPQAAQADFAPLLPRIRSPLLSGHPFAPPPTPTLRATLISPLQKMRMNSARAPVIVRQLQIRRGSRSVHLGARRRVCAARHGVRVPYERGGGAIPNRGVVQERGWTTGRVAPCLCGSYAAEPALPFGKPSRIGSPARARVKAGLGKRLRGTSHGLRGYTTVAEKMRNTEHSRRPLSAAATDTRGNTP
jgi:hypothetical protein